MNKIKNQIIIIFAVIIHDDFMLIKLRRRLVILSFSKKYGAKIKYLAANML